MVAIQPRVWARTKTDDWCGREDLKLHTLTGTCTSSMRVCQFRHDREPQARSNSLAHLPQPSAAAQPRGPCAFNPTHSPDAQHSKRPPVCRPAAPPKIHLWAYLSAREIREPIRSPPNGPRTLLSRRLSDRRLPPHLEVFGPHTAGRHSGSARTRRSSGPNPASESQVRSRPSSGLRHWLLRTGRKNDDSCSHGRRGSATPPDSRKADRSKNIFRVGAAHRKEPAFLESIVLANRSSAGSDSQLNGLPWRI